MVARVLDGKVLAAQHRQKVKMRIDNRIARGLRPPGLAVILVGANPASQIYVRHKHLACKEVGIISKSYDLPIETSTEKLLNVIDDLNNDTMIDGILVQLPLPAHINNSAVIGQIAPHKDIDGFHPYNIGRLAVGLPLLRPCTPKGIMSLLAETGVALAGREVVLVGESNIVGRPMALELLAARCTITICHDKTVNVAKKVKKGEIVIVAVGIPHLIKGKWIRYGAIVIDVGINRVNDGRLVGDVEFDVAQQRASWITPVPGGVGPMTVASLLENTLQAAELCELL
jgi:methylenetetrahydrofolate dehydrogenase (NADP+)/methenyltetrahydrofolate cyclohydrolase